MKQYGKVLQILVERKYKLLVDKIITKNISDCNGVFTFLFKVSLFYLLELTLHLRSKL
jgi:hypothetical protein